jgi:UDP-N-acetylglucosamine transferase subunit ALG13
VIFVTVGTQLAFDRLISAVDAWAEHAEQPVFAQIGPGGYIPRFIDYENFISPAECLERMANANAIVAHAGMGTIISALELGTPVLVMPRRASLGEHRNDHQLATAARFGDLGQVTVAGDEHELVARLDALDTLTAKGTIGPHASESLIAAVRGFIDG